MDPDKPPMPNNIAEETKTTPELDKSPEPVRSKEEQEDYEKAIIEIIASGYKKMEETHNGLEGLRRQYRGFTDEEIKNIVGEKAFTQTIEQGKKYHTTGHLTSLYTRAPMMAEAMGMSRNKLRLARGAISWHDTVIAVKQPPEYKPYDTSKDEGLDEAGRLKARKDNAKVIAAMAARMRGAREGDFSAGAEGNEAKSARDLAEQMRLKIDRNGKQIFTEQEIENSILAVDVTYPGVDFGPDFSGANFEGKPDDVPPNKELLKLNPALGAKIDELKGLGIIKGPKFFQPHLEKMLEEGKPVPEEVLIMAMTDLGGSGIATTEQFAEEGDSEFWEVFPNIEKNLDELSSNAEMGLERQATIDAMKGWLKSQVGFVTWQALRFEKIMYLLKEKTHQLSSGPSQKETRLRQIFGNYIKNIDASRARAEKIISQVDQIQAEGLSEITDPEAKVVKEEENRVKAFKYIAKEMHYNVQA